MSEYSNSHEREERAKMGRGLWHSIFGLLLCWLPGVGLILSISGFIRQMVRLTVKYRARLTVYLTISIVSVVVCVGTLIGEAFLYSRDSNFPDKVGHVAWQALTGQKEYPWQGAAVASGDIGEGFDYSGYTQPGLGVMDGQEFIDPSEEEEIVMEDDVYYDGEDESSLDDADAAYESDPDADMENEESPDDAEDMPNVKDLMNELKNPENLLEGAF